MSLDSHGAGLTRRLRPRGLDYRALSLSRMAKRRYGMTQKGRVSFGCWLMDQRIMRLLAPLLGGIR